MRTLSPEAAASRLPVRLRGVVTFFDETLYSRFIQDETAGIYLRESTNTPALQPGQLVEVEGTTSPGEYAPIVEPARVSVIGTAPLPAAKPTTFEHLASGREDSQFVEISGIVRSITFDAPSQHHIITLASGGGRLAVHARNLPGNETGGLIDATLRVRGVCSTQFNRQRQLFAIRLMVPRPEDLVVETPAPPDPFSVPLRPIESLLQFTPQGTYGRRVKVAGTVVYQRPGNALFIQKGGFGLQIQTRQDTPLRIGDRVEVLGFTSPGQYTPVLEDAIYRGAGSGPAVEPAVIGVDEALSGSYDCRLVKIRAKLLDRSRRSQEQFLVLEAGKFIFHAVLEAPPNENPFQNLRNGSEVAVAGVCLIEPGEWQAGEQWRARSFKVLLRASGDVTVLKEPPWWTLQRLLWTVGVLLLAVLAAFAWVGVLRRKVREQTGIIREQMLTDAALKERYQDLFENANDMVFTHDLAGRITSVNQAGEKLLQHSREQLLQVNILDLVANDQRPAARSWLDGILSGAELPTAEWDFLNKTGSRVKLEISSRLIEQQGRPVEVEGVARDVTERRRLERELLEISNREQRRIGHDLHDGVCQQLAGIAYRAQILEDQLQEQQLSLAPEAARIVALINEATVNARNVARGLFPVRLEENGLAAALEELSDTASSRFEVNCTFETGAAPALLVANETALHLYYIAHEALINAIKHGKARIVAISMRPAGQYQRLLIKDDGAGFASLPSGTTGMGIRIMRYRAKVIGATLTITSAPGKGTEVACLFSISSYENTRETPNART